MDNDQTPSEKTAALAEEIARNLATEYAQLGKTLDKANRIAAEARRRANAEGAESANKSCDCRDSARQTESHNAEIVSTEALRDLIDETAEGYATARTLKDVEAAEIRRRADFMSLRWLVRSENPCEYFFPQFGRLPPEIRIMIWKMAMPDKQQLFVAGRPSSRFIMPTIGHVCQESRDVAVKETKDCSCGDGTLFYFPSNGDGPMECPEHPTIFDARQGILILPEQEDRAYQGGNPLRLPLLTTETQHIVIDLSLGGPDYTNWNIETWDRYWDLTPSSLKNKTISVMNRPPTVIDRSTTSPQIVDALFGNNAHFVLDLSDHNAVVRVAGIIDHWRALVPDDFDNKYPGAVFVQELASDETENDWWNDMSQYYSWTPARSILEEYLLHQMGRSLPDDHPDKTAAARKVFIESNIQTGPIHIFALDDQQCPATSNSWWRYYTDPSWRRLRRAWYLATG